MKLLSRVLISSEYLQHLQRDLGAADVCRFLVAYVSDPGLTSIGLGQLTEVLRMEHSFGIASMTCRFGEEPLMDLQRGLGKGAPTRLKYFMEPHVKERGEPVEINLFHSKLVYLRLPNLNKSILYVGSHNWTKHALGPGSNRNAEASLRLETDFLQEHLLGAGESVISGANEHLLSAWNAPLCFPATEDRKPAFEEWKSKACLLASETPTDYTVVLLAVHNNPLGSRSVDWQELEGRGLYFQALLEDEGQLVWRSNDRLLVLVWESEEALHSAQQPMLLQCRISTNKAGLDSELRGTNVSTDPIAGFKAVLFDEPALSALQRQASKQPRSLTLWSGRTADYFDFEFPTVRAESSQVDGNVNPKYQFYFEVMRVVYPAEPRPPGRVKYVWSPETLAVAASRQSAKVERSPGYRVDPDTYRRIMDFLERTMHIKPGNAKVLPYAEGDYAKTGRRISDHPLHDTFIGSRQRESQKDFYEKTKPGELVAELDLPVARSGAIPRCQRVVTARLSDLSARWHNAAESQK